ncbi:hypothetical protein GCM10010500_74450 [Streptomyces nigrescens]|nr:hypothetical protein GCM10010500_74450 [Streptomyces libani subsp. libani]
MGRKAKQSHTPPPEVRHRTPTAPRSGPGPPQAQRRGTRKHHPRPSPAQRTRNGEQPPRRESQKRGKSSTSWDTAHEKMSALRRAGEPTREASAGPRPKRPPPLQMGPPGGATHPRPVARRRSTATAGDHTK